MHLFVPFELGLNVPAQDSFEQWFSFTLNPFTLEVVVSNYCSERIKQRLAQQTHIQLNVKSLFLQFKIRVIYKTKERHKAQ